MTDVSEPRTIRVSTTTIPGESRTIRVPVTTTTINLSTVTFSQEDADADLRELAHDIASDKAREAYDDAYAVECEEALARLRGG